ncbi:hypothetical protein TNCT_578151 [Trichonephila clavata]|uniref:Uncharacterized protein n=1 Tax=Trichonephila clavata TaxID=2740835 RepID=A0A8X6FF12_TRICU|nr:hypothetical protein TNCT_578151 [Trichonephila clavata]
MQMSFKKYRLCFCEVGHKGEDMVLLFKMSNDVTELDCVCEFRTEPCPVESDSQFRKVVLLNKADAMLFDHKNIYNRDRTFVEIGIIVILNFHDI